MIRTCAIIILASIVLLACRPAINVSPGMSMEKVKSNEGEPVAKFKGKSGKEYFKYQIESGFMKKGNVIYLSVADGSVENTFKKGQNFLNIELGMPENLVKEILGPPRSISAIDNIKYLNYFTVIQRGYAPHDLFVRLVDGYVESYGKTGDFDSTKKREEILNVNISDKSK